MDKPNILMIQSDQHRFDCLGINGHPLLKTPRLDRLATDGVNFTHAFTPIPLCGPARSCLLTGQWSHTHGSLTNWDAPHWKPLREDTPTFSQPLRDAGYYLSHLAKWHVDKRRDPTRFGYHEAMPDSKFEDPYIDWRKEQGHPPRPIDDRYFSQVDAHFGYTDPGIPPEASRLGYGATLAIAHLERLAKTGQPFFFAWNPPEPHFPCVVPEPYASMYPADEIPPWPGFDDVREGEPYMHAQMRRTWGVEDWKWADWAPSVSRYLGEVSLLDAQIGRVLDALERLGLAGNTLVVYTTDHGDLCGNHCMIDKHHIMYDDVTRVPLIARWPGVIPEGNVHDGFVTSSLDLATTFCEAAGASAPSEFEGKSLLPAFTRNEPLRDEVFSEYHGYQFGLYSQRMARTRSWKYVWNPTDWDELYDLRNDPAERVNVALRPEFAEPLADMRRRLVAWMESTRDHLLNQWSRKQLLRGMSR